MSIVDRYLFRQIIRPMGMALLVAVLVLVVERMVQLLDLVLGASGPVKVFFELVGYLVPHYLGMALPLSLLLGIMIAFNRLSRDGEIEALFSAGVGLFRQSLSPLIAAVVVAALAAGIVGYLKPYGRYAYESIVYAVSNTAFHALVRVGVFTRFDDVTFLIEGIKPDGTGVTRVFLYEDEPDGRTSAVAAGNGRLVRTDDRRIPVLRLFDGVRITAGPAGAEPEAGGEVSVLRFDELRKTLGDQYPALFRARGVHEREMTLDELWRNQARPPEGIRRSDLVAEFHDRIVFILSIPLLPLLAVSLALGRQRAERHVGLAAGVLIVVVYYQLLDFGKNLVESGAVLPVVGLWLPYLAFAALAATLFHRAATVVPRTSVLSGVHARAAFVRRFWRRPVERDAPL